MKRKLNCILLVDDDEGTNFLHKLILKEADIAENILVALNGEQALEIINNVDNKYPQPELIFLDINMPKMNGWEFLDEYQKYDESRKNEHIIVMLTVSLNPDDKKKAGSIPEITGFMSKPLNMEMLELILKNHFES